MQHLVAAAYEAPLGSLPGDDEILGEGWREAAERLVTMGELRQARGDRYMTRGGDFVAGRISLRSASPDSVAVIDTTSGEMLGQVEAERAFSTVHPGAIYLHLGRSYEVAELDLGAGGRSVRPFDGDYYTQVKKETEVYVEETRTTRSALGVELSFGAVSVSEQVIAYQRKRLGDNKVLDIIALDLPEQDFVTQALWYVIGDRMAAALPDRGAAGRAARLRARPDRGAAADRDVRPLGHRRPLHQHPPPDRRADDLHLRRPPRRRRHHPAGLRGVRAAGRRRRPPDPRVPVRRRLPLVRAEPQVRQPERAPAQGRARWS